MANARRVGVDGPTASSARCWVVQRQHRRRSVTELKLISIDTSKHVFTLHGVGDRGEVVLRRGVASSAA
jgi:hypothetical protein